MLLNEETRRQFADVGKARRAIVDYIEDWYRRELERLPSLNINDVAKAQGRVQVLGELRKLFDVTP